MNPELFFDAIGEVDESFYHEALVYRQRPFPRGKFAAAAACAAFVFCVSLTPLQQDLPGQEVCSAEAAPPGATVSDPPAAGSALPVRFNEVSAPSAVTSGMALAVEDYSPMTYEELLEYFAVSLPISDTFPYLTLQNHDFGVYQSPNRGIYFDGNVVMFTRKNGTGRIRIGLAKVSLHLYDIFKLTEEALVFTNVNGRELALFHYTGKEGEDCYYAEFLQGDVAFTVGSEALSAREYLQCLEVLVESVLPAADSVHTLTGEIIAIDPYANHIGLLGNADGDPQHRRGYGIDLPDEWSAAEYSPGDTITVTYTGEPATICTIWAGQLMDITRLP